MNGQKILSILIMYSDIKNLFFIFQLILRIPRKYWVFSLNTQIKRYSESVFDFSSILRIPRKYWVFSLYTQILRTRFGYNFNTQNTQKILGILFIYSETQNSFWI